jgi:hypothetical protein
MLAEGFWTAYTFIVADDRRPQQPTDHLSACVLHYASCLRAPGGAANSALSKLSEAATPGAFFAACLPGGARILGAMRIIGCLRRFGGMRILGFL